MQYKFARKKKRVEEDRIDNTYRQEFEDGIDKYLQHESCLEVVLDSRSFSLNNKESTLYHWG